MRLRLAQAQPPLPNKQLLSPRLLGLLPGSVKSRSAFSFRAGHCWWWIPVVAPTLGSLAGTFVYNILIDFHNRPLECKKVSEQDVEANKPSELQQRM